MEQKIKEILDTVRHPETGCGVAESGFVAHVAISDTGIAVTLRFGKARDPFAAKLRRQAEAVLSAHYPAQRIHVEVEQRKPTAETKSLAIGISRVVAIASGKGGVGKSTVTANLAVALRNLGFRVGVLDADIYGPSQPRMFGLEGYRPRVGQADGAETILPAEAMGIEVMSIGFFIRPEDALLWRGPMAVNALRQLIHQTEWGALDYLLIDLPPGTGDIHLSLMSELKIDAAVIVSTPQQIAVADVRRGVEMFRNPQVDIPVAGLVENMAWFTPEAHPNEKYYLFGHGGARDFACDNNVELLGEIPVIQSIMEGADEGTPASSIEPRVESYYHRIAEKIVHKLG